MYLRIILILSFITESACLPFSSSDCPIMCSCRLRPVSNQPEECYNCDVTNDENNNNNNDNPDDPCYNCDRTAHACVGCNTGTNDVTIHSVTCRNIALIDIPFMTPTIISLLDLSENKLTRLYSGVFGHVRHVITLKLSHNVIRDVGREAFRSLGYIQRLDLDDNHLARLDASMFTGAETLENLNLSHNRLETIDGAFTRLTNLTRLDLRHNLLTELSRTTFKGLVNLRYLILTDNKLSFIDSRAFRHLEKLVYLVLKGNEKLGLMKSFRFHFNSASLTYIDLSECGFEDVPRGLPSSTRYLQLRRNKLTSLTRTSFSECPHVYTLVLDENNITKIENDTFDLLIRLQQLWLSNNKLRRIPDVVHASLERLLLDFNLLTRVDQILPKSSVNQLNTLSFTGNNISSIVPSAFSRLIFLDTLRLDFNQIEYIDNTTFNGLSELRVLQLSNNPIKVIGTDCFQSLVSLESFYMTDVVNSHVSIIDEVFQAISSTLVLLDISNSPGVIHRLFSEEFNQFHQLSKSFSAGDAQISIIVNSSNTDHDLHRSDEPIFHILASAQKANESVFSVLTELSLIGSELITLRLDLPKLLPRLLTLQMSSNNWHCNSSLEWFSSWISSNAIVVDDGGEGLHCLTPNSVKGKSLLSFSNVDNVDSNGFSSTLSPSRTSSEKRSTNKENLLSYQHVTQSIKSLNNKHIVPSTLSSSNQSRQRLSSLLPQLNYNSTDPKKLIMSGSITLGQSTAGYKLFQSPVISSTLLPNSENSSTVNISTPVDSLNRPTVTERVGRLYSLVSPRDDNNKTIDSHTLIVLIVTVSLTILAAVIIIGIIICITKRKRQLCVKDESIRSTEPFASKTSSVGSVEGRKLTSTKDVQNKSVVDIVSLLPNGVTVLGQSTVEVMALVPGRDVNHEGPRRVYKWEDF